MTSTLPRADAAHAAFVRWTVLVTAAESLGFLAPAVAGVLGADLPLTAAVAALLAAGAVEGAVLGWAQATVLRDKLPGLRVGRWIALTAGAAVVAYAVGSAIAAISSTPGWPRIAVAVLGSVVILTSIGAAQWFELRHHLRDAARWVLVTAVAWMAALGVFLVVTTPLWHEGQRAWVAILIGVGGGVVMALVQAVGTGLWLFRAEPSPAQHGRHAAAALRRGDAPVGTHDAAGRW